MKKILERLQKGPKPPALVQSKLELIRIRKLLENARAIMTRVADGQEKLKEEYIFDRHYVLSLVDQVIESAGILVFDAVALIPDGGESLYNAYDQLKDFAIEQFIKNNASNAGNIFPKAKDIPEEPEFELLFNVISWIAGPLQKQYPTMINFIRNIFDHIIPVLRNGHYSGLTKSWIELNDAGMNHKIGVVDLESESIKTGHISIKDLECRPLGLMLIGARRDASISSAKTSQPLKNWVAFTGKDHLSLRGKDPDNRIYLEATFSGHLDSDFLFIFAEIPIDLKKIIPEGFFMEKTRLGALAWSYGVSGQTLENHLARLGELLL